MYKLIISRVLNHLIVKHFNIIVYLTHKMDGGKGYGRCTNFKVQLYEGTGPYMESMCSRTHVPESGLLGTGAVGKSLAL